MVIVSPPVYPAPELVTKIALTRLNPVAGSIPIDAIQIGRAHV